MHPEDLPQQYHKYKELAMMHFQEDLELRCYQEAGCSEVAGAQRMKDFVEGKPSRLIPPSSFAAGLQPSRLDQWLPPFISSRLRKGFATFGRAAKGFLTNEAIVIGVETRTCLLYTSPSPRD